MLKRYMIQKISLENGCYTFDISKFGTIQIVNSSYIFANSLFEKKLVRMEYYLKKMIYISKNKNK